MAILMTIVIGFIVGLVARFFKPGNDKLGFIMTTVLGIGGAVIAGYLGQVLGFYAVGEPAGFIMSVIGAILLLYLFQAVSGRKST